MSLKGYPAILRVINLTTQLVEFGRRFTYLSSLILTIVSQIWLAVAKNTGDFIGGHVLFGVGRAPYEALVAISIGDVFFAHERGLGLGVYAFGIMFGSSVGPICSGYMIKTLHWRWVYRFGAILCGVIWVVMYFTLEESRFIRTSSRVSGTLGEAVRPVEASDFQDPEMMQQDFKGEKVGLQRQSSNTTVHRLGEILDAKSFRFQFRLWTIFPGTFQEFIRQCYQPLQLAWFPAIFWVRISSVERLVKIDSRN